MQDFFNFNAVLFILGCIALGLGYAWLLYKNDAVLSNKNRNVLAGVRALAVAMLAWLIFSPLIRTVKYTLEKPIVILAHDNSSSIKHTASKDFNYENYQQEMLALKEMLSEHYEVKTYSFGDSVKRDLEFTANNTITNAAKWASQLHTEMQNRNVGAVIWATDGLFNTGGSPVFDLQKLNAAVYSIALGNTSASRDLIISNVNHNDIVFLNNEFQVEILIQAHQLKDQTLKISLYDKVGLLKEQTITIDRESFFKELNFSVPAREKGLQAYRIEASKLNDELTYSNNMLKFFVDVVDKKKSVLIAAHAPHPDISAIKNALELNAQYEVEVVLVDKLADLDLNKFAAVILHQLPSQYNKALAFLDKVKARQTPVWHILGANSDVQALNSVQSVVDLRLVGSRFSYVNPAMSNGFSVFQMEEYWPQLLKKADPFLLPGMRIEAKRPIQVLFEQRIGNVQTGQPLWFFHNGADQKAAFLLGEGIWKWRFHADEDSINPMVLANKTMQFLTVADDKRKFKVAPSKRTFNAFEPVIMNGTLVDQSYNVINSPEVKLELINASGESFKYTLDRTAQAYKLNLGHLKSGNYKYSAQTTVGDERLADSGQFVVVESLLELQHGAANHEVLKSISDLTGGKMVDPKDIRNIGLLISQSDSMKTISFEDRKYRSAINFPLLFFVILCLLSGEWFFRKRLGQL